ncbi:hypothetical protein OQA88_7383 [Cercophora sp. LCS_1]
MNSPASTLFHQREFAAWAYNTSQALLQTEVRLGLDVTSSLYHQAVVEELLFKVSHGLLDDKDLLEYKDTVHESTTLRREAIRAAVSNPDTVLLCGHVLDLNVKSLPPNSLTERNLALGQSLVPWVEQAKSEARECVLKRQALKIWEALPSYLRDIVDKPGKFYGRSFEDKWIETCKSPGFVRKKRRVLEKIRESARGWRRVKGCACAGHQNTSAERVDGEWLGRLDGPSLQYIYEVNEALICRCRTCFLL